MNPDIFETAYFVTLIRVYGVLEQSVAKRCSFGQRIHWFHENGRSILSMVKQERC